MYILSNKLSLMTIRRPRHPYSVNYDQDQSCAEYGEVGLIHAIRMGQRGHQGRSYSRDLSER